VKRTKSARTQEREERSIRARLILISRPGHGSVPANEYVSDVRALLSIIESQRVSLENWVRLACKR